MYGKIFETLYRGTLHGLLGPQVVFIYLLVHSDPDGNVTVSPLAISHDTGLAADEVASSIAHLEAPDPNSTTPDEEGRRIVRVGTAWSWHITNHEKYQRLRDADQRRRQVRDAVARHREHVIIGKPLKAAVSRRKPVKAPTDVYVSTDVATDLEKQTHSSNGEDENLSLEAWFEAAFWPEYPRKQGKKHALKALKAAFRGKTGEAEDSLGDKILDGLHRYRQSLDGKDPQFIALAATWVNGQRWEDEL